MKKRSQKMLEVFHLFVLKIKNSWVSILAYLVIVLTICGMFFVVIHFISPFTSQSDLDYYEKTAYEVYEQIERSNLYDENGIKTMAASSIKTTIYGKGNDFPLIIKIDNVPSSMQDISIKVSGSGQGFVTLETVNGKIHCYQNMQHTQSIIVSIILTLILSGCALFLLCVIISLIDRFIYNLTCYYS